MELIIDCKIIAESLNQLQILLIAVMKPVEGTILTVARETAEKQWQHIQNMKML